MPLNHRFHPVIWCLSPEWHFGDVSVKFSLNPTTAQKMANLRNTVRRLIIILLSLYFLLIISASFWSSYGKILAESHYEANDNQFAKYCHTPRNNRFQQVFLCWSSRRNFWALTVKFPLSPIVAQNMANLKHTVTGLLFTVFRYFVCAYHVSNILESLQWNSYLKKLRLIRWLVWKILSHASESSFSATLMVLTIRTTL